MGRNQVNLLSFTDRRPVHYAISKIAQAADHVYLPPSHAARRQLSKIQKATFPPVFPRSEDIIRNTVIPLYIELAVDNQPVIVRKGLAPPLFAMVDGPVVTVEPPPEDGSAAAVQKML